MAKFSTSGQDFDDYDQEYYEECKEDGLGVIDQSQIEYQESFSSKNQKTANKKNDANHLLGFFTEEAKSTPKLPPGPRYKASKPQMAILSKDQYVHAAMKFVLKNPSEDGTKTESNYIMNFYEANECINWRDVVQAQYDLASETDVQCPICMEPLSQMVCPRLTKCGHIYCFACML